VDQVKLLRDLFLQTGVSQSNAFLIDDFFFFGTETDSNWEMKLKARYKIFQPNVEDEKWLSVWGIQITPSETQTFACDSAITPPKEWYKWSSTTYLNISNQIIYALL
jgi:hypothetical protein